MKLDAHKKDYYATAIGEEGGLVSKRRFLNQMEELDSFLQQLEPCSHVVLEMSVLG